MNVWDIVILALVAAALFFAVRKVRKNRRTGGCGCGCAGCTKSAQCGRPGTGDRCQRLRFSLSGSDKRRLP